MDFIETTAANQLYFPPMVPKCILKKGRRVGGHLTICDNDDCDITSDDQRLRRCTKCRYTFYCSKDCQVKAWSQHKSTCHSVIAPNDTKRWMKLSKLFLANRTLLLYLQIALLCGFNLLDATLSPDTPLHATLYIGIEPSDIYETMRILHGRNPPVSDDNVPTVERMFQVHDVVPHLDEPFPEQFRSLWETERQRTNEGGSNDFVVVVTMFEGMDHGKGLATGLRINHMFIAEARAGTLNITNAIDRYGVKKLLPVSLTSCIELPSHSGTPDVATLS